MKFEATLMPFFALALIAAPNHSSAQPPRPVVEACGLCHGMDGNSTFPQFPSLAGQPAAYIEAQLKAFRSHSRADPPAQAYMWGMASQLDDDTIAQLAAYFAARPVRAVRSTASVDSVGRQLYETGLPEQGIPACASCHTASGRGVAKAAALSGQHPEYMARQLSYFKARLRTGDPVMLQLCSKLTVEQMAAVADYAATH